MHVTSSQVSRELWYKLLEQERGLPSVANQTQPGCATVTEKHVWEFQWDSASSGAQGPEYQRGQVPEWPTTANSKLTFLCVWAGSSYKQCKLNSFQKYLCCCKMSTGPGCREAYYQVLNEVQIAIIDRGWASRGFQRLAFLVWEWLYYITG